MERPVTPSAAHQRLTIAISAMGRVVEMDRAVFKGLPALQRPPTLAVSSIHSLAAI